MRNRTFTLQWSALGIFTTFFLLQITNNRPLHLLPALVCPFIAMVKMAKYNNTKQPYGKQHLFKTGFYTSLIIMAFLYAYSSIMTYGEVDIWGHVWRTAFILSVTSVGTMLFMPIAILSAKRIYSV